MNIKRNLLIVICFVLVCIILACGSSAPSSEEELPINEKITVEAKPTVTEETVDEPTKAPTDTSIPEPTETPIPEPTTWMGVIYCPECEGIPLALWQNIDNIGTIPGEVNHGDNCTVFDKGVTDGIEKYKLDCDEKIGWLRSEGVIPAGEESTQEQTEMSTEVSSQPDTSDISGYMPKIVTAIDLCFTAYNQISKFSLDVSDDPLKILDEEWKMQVAEALDGVQFCGEQLVLDRDVPPGFDDIDTLLVKAGEESLMMVEDYIFGIDNIDVDSVISAGKHTDNFGVYIGQAIELVGEMNQ